MGGLVSRSRFENWPEVLDAYLKDVRQKAFVRGDFDCALFAVGACLAMTGVDYGQEFRNLYSSKDAAEALITSKGYANLEALADATLGAALPTTMMAQRGDAIMFETEDGPAIGIVDLSGRYIVAVSEERGVVRLPLRYGFKAWRI